MGAKSERERRFLELVEANRARLVRIARAYAGPEWNDLYQEILLQIWRASKSFEGRSSPSTWLYRVALNTAMTWRRRKAAKPPIVAKASWAAEAAGALSPRDPMHVLEEFIGTLNAADRAILVLYLEDTSYEDIAEVTGLSEGNVGVRINRIKRAFVERYVGD